MLKNPWSLWTLSWNFVYSSNKNISKTHRRQFCFRAIERSSQWFPSNALSAYSMTVNSIAMGVSLTFSRSRKAMHQSHYYFRSCCNFFYLQTNTNLTNVVCNPIVMLTGFFKDCGTGMTYKIIRHTCLKASSVHSDTLHHILFL